ncbi:MAG: response regulator [Ktedonobacteraceae bacterium]
MAHIGLLEDNANIADLCAKFLGLSGHCVTIYSTPEQCLRALFPADFRQTDMFPGFVEAPLPVCRLPFELLILDLGLPQVDGVDILRYLITHPRTRTLPIVLFTAASQHEVLRAQQVAPHIGIVEKPFKIQTLSAAITRALAPVL